MKHTPIFLLKIILFFLFVTNFANAQQKISTAWGEFTIDQPVLEELLKSKAMQRIKKIDQSGPVSYFGLVPHFSRYEHSIGVLALLEKAGVTLDEQVTGLLHDTSHTAFSHVGDHMFYQDNVEKSYQDTIHTWFLREMKIANIVGKYGINIESLDPDLPSYTALERPVPELCADRIQYNIHTGVMLGKISEQDAIDIVNDLQFKDDKWFFTNPALAKKFANLPLDFTKNFWGSHWNNAFYDLFSKALHRAMEINLISSPELHFGADIDILNKLNASDDAYIKKLLTLCKNIKTGNNNNVFTVVAYGKGDINTRPKFRGIDPLVLTNGEYKKLSQIDSKFKKEYNKLNTWCAKGYGLKMTIDIASK